jgi:ribosomal protein S18 acetylase RimI-like enzyme
MMADFNAGEATPFDRDGVARAAAELVGDARIGFILLAEREQPVGYGVVTYNYDLEFAGRDAFITELYVSPAERGSGLGRQLLDAIEAHARARDVKALHLLVRPENTRAKRLYAARGYARNPREMMTKVLV